MNLIVCSVFCMQHLPCHLIPLDFCWALLAIWFYWQVPECMFCVPFQWVPRVSRGAWPTYCRCEWVRCSCTADSEPSSTRRTCRNSAAPPQPGLNGTQAHSTAAHSRLGPVEMCLWVRTELQDHTNGAELQCMRVCVCERGNEWKHISVCVYV